jgi:hypothetical protein
MPRPRQPHRPVEDALGESDRTHGLLDGFPPSSVRDNHSDDSDRTQLVPRRHRRGGVPVALQDRPNESDRTPPTPRCHPCDRRPDVRAPDEHPFGPARARASSTSRSGADMTLNRHSPSTAPRSNRGDRIDHPTRRDSIHATRRRLHGSGVIAPKGEVSTSRREARRGPDSARGSRRSGSTSASHTRLDGPDPGGYRVVSADRGPMTQTRRVRFRRRARGSTTGVVQERASIGDGDLGSVGGSVDGETRPASDPTGTIHAPSNCRVDIDRHDAPSQAAGCLDRARALPAPLTHGLERWSSARGPDLQSPGRENAGSTPRPLSTTDPIHRPRNQGPARPPWPRSIAPEGL